MKAIRVHKHGGTEVLNIDDIPVPVVEADEVLVRVKATSINHLDLWVRRGLPGISLPITLGSDAAGIVEEKNNIKNENSPVHTGDEVVIIPFRTCGYCSYCLGGDEQLCQNYHISGENADGTMAEFIKVPPQYLLPKPKNLNWHQAAAFPLAFLTAYHMLTNKVKIIPQNWVLIWGASSGIGHAAIQIARHFKAKIITTAGGDEKVAFAKECGAEFVIDYKKDDVPKMIHEITNGHGVDFIFEHVGQSSWQDSMKVLARGGKVVTCGATTGPVVRIDLRRIFTKHQQIIGSTMGNRQDLVEITKLIEQGHLKPHVDSVYSPNEIINAHEHVEKGKHKGKVVISFS